VFISGRDAANMPARGQEVQVFTWLSVSQDAFRLYGFLDEDDLDIFKLLINVSGVGPKAALGILSVLTADALRLAVLSDDVKAIAKAPGIGNKTAQKVILELKDKMNLEDAMEHKLVGESQIPLHSSAKEEAILALSALGYSSGDALRAVNRCDLTEDMDTETILKLALKQI
ncbi:MAG: Holliday junction branch migration protein RuvA, partial [Lachnospiraceae bacterium]|nr:Holliday junction branch migration protein RuvA [Lachnospiraceae bacterium]